MNVSSVAMGPAEHNALEALRLFTVERRTFLKKSQRDLAKDGGISAASVSHLEAGRETMPKRVTLEGLAKGLEVKLEVLDAVMAGEAVDPHKRIIRLEKSLDDEAAQEADKALFSAIGNLPISQHNRDALERMVKGYLRQLDEEEGTG